MRIDRNTVVLTAELYKLACRAEAGTHLIARTIRGGDHFTLLGRRLGDDPSDDEVAIWLGPDGLDLSAGSVRGLVPGRSGGSTAIDAVRVVGDSWRLLLVETDATSPSVFDRQIRAFGSAGQHLLAHLRVGVVAPVELGRPSASS